MPPPSIDGGDVALVRAFRAVRPRGKDDVMDSARIARAVLGLRLECLWFAFAEGE
jgi:hypothetical protein